MLRLGTGSIALDYVAASPILERAVDALTVVYVLPDCVASVRYRWNALLLDALEGLFLATNLYASMVAECAAYRKRPKLSKDGIRQRQVYGSINDAGAVTFNL